MAHQVLLAGAAFFEQTEAPSDLCVVAELGMDIERQVKGIQVQVVDEAIGDALAPRAGDAALFVAPEPAVMDEQRVGPRLDRGVTQRQARRHPGHQRADLRPAFEHQCVRTIVLAAARLEQLIQLARQVVALDVALRFLEMDHQGAISPLPPMVD